MNIDDVFEWGEIKRLPTKRGPMTLQTAPLPKGFWDEYNRDDQTQAKWREAFKRAQVNLSKNREGKWELQRWRADDRAIERQSKRYAESFAQETGVEFPIAAGYTARPYQLAGANYIRQNDRVLLADDQGLGKTLQTILFANYDPETRLVLVVCPPNLKLNWKKEVERFGTRDAKVFIMDGPCKDDAANGMATRLHMRRKDSSAQTWVVTGYTNLNAWSKVVHDTEWDLAICDEIHFVKNHTSKRSQAVVGKYNRKTYKNERGIRAKVKVGLTGTPIENRPSEIISCLCWLDRILHFGGPLKFKGKYCGGPDGRGFGSAKAKEELNRALRESCMLRRMKVDVLTELPPKRKQIMTVESTRAIQRAEEETLEGLKTGRIYKKLRALDAGTDSKEFLELSKKLVSAFKADFTQMAALRAQMSVAKIPHTVTLLKESLDAHQDAILVGVLHLEALDAICDELEAMGVTFVRYQGAMNKFQKEQAVERFQAGEARVFVGQIKAAGVGITLTQAKHVICHEQDWSPGVMAQFEDRACLLSGNLVFTSRGLIPIEAVKPGDEVLSHLGNLREVRAVGSRLWMDGRVTTVKYSGWTPGLTCTFDHRVFVEREGNQSWREASSLLPGDYMLFPRFQKAETLAWVEIRDSWRAMPPKKTRCDCGRRPILARGRCSACYQKWKKSGKPRGKKHDCGRSRYKPLPQFIKITDAWLELFGWYAAKGFSSISPDKGKFISLSGHEDDFPVLEKHRKVIEGLGVNCSIYRSKKSKAIELRAYSTELALWFRDWFGHMAGNKRFPQEIMNLSPAEAAIVLRSYIDGDGYRRKGTEEWVSVSKTLCYQVCVLAAKCGYSPTMRFALRGSNQTAWIGSYTKAYKSDSKWVRRKIRAVSTAWQRRPRVYDLEVEGDESFVSGLASVHNCRMGQDSSVLIQYVVVDMSLDAYVAQLSANKQVGINDVLNTNLEEGRTEPVEARHEVQAELPAQTEKSAEPRPSEPEPVELDFFEGEFKEQANLPLEKRQLISDCLNHLVSCCDGAQAEDGAGFSKIDAGYGRFIASLAPQDMDRRFALDGQKLCNRYRRQLSGMWI